MKNAILLCIFVLTTLSACSPVAASPTLSVSTPTDVLVHPTATIADSPAVLPTQTTQQSADGKILVVNGSNYSLMNPDGSEPALLYVNADNQLGMASLSPDATKFAYFLNNVVYILDIKTGKTITLSKEDIGPAGGDQIRWSPDGTKLALTCSIERQPYGGICLIDAHSGEIEVLLNEKNTDKFCYATHDNYIALLDWSKDGSILVYICGQVLAQGQKPIFSIYLYDFASQTSQKIFDAATQDTIWDTLSISISPDNRWLLISGAHQDHFGQVFLMDLSNNAIKQLTHETGYFSSAMLWRNDSKSFYLTRTPAEQSSPESNVIMNIDGEILSTLKIEGRIIK